MALSPSTAVAPASPPSKLTVDALPELLKHDTRVKLAGLDVDGILRGKLVSKRKFLSVAEAGFGFCSVIFGWDMHDQTYDRELGVSNAANGYRDMLAVPDLSSYRRIPWEQDVPFFLVSFLDPESRKPICACPRGLLKTQLDRLRDSGCGAMAGAEYEFFTFKTPESSAAVFVRNQPPDQLQPLTEGMFGYSLTRPVHNQKWYYDVYDACDRFRCDIEGWHTESGPGVFEAALEFNEAAEMADRASLFKYVVRSVSVQHAVTPCFMAKPRYGLPGNSGHIHVSIVDSSGKNLLASDPDNKKSCSDGAEYPDVAGLSDLGRHFLAGVLTGLPDVMPMLAPTVNSYKRLVENFWAPVSVSWGLEHRAASIRIISPPTSKPSATRLEIRVPGADTNPHYALAAILGCGWRGVKAELPLPCPPLSSSSSSSSTSPPSSSSSSSSSSSNNPPGEATNGGSGGQQRLAKTLKEATARFVARDSVAREVFGHDFVDHFGGTRENEVRLFDEAVTDWEMKRYLETV
ncbi:glutamine synthetase [Ophiocordyceps camponoti-floridani]|uniref:Glutamine synthetase n=1 Tax=Ophiocordyceps camponoti-floridani TaxID=2030778 RepID=A0A8H4QAC4_9HYPO|nr:glutamine synthetase [Ophiocordyceps camponoti-floridani]